MLNNPMSTDYTKKNLMKYSKPLQDVFYAVNGYAYDSCFPIEGRLGEFHPKDMFDYNALVEAVRVRVRVRIEDENDLYGTMLRRAFDASAVDGAKRNRVIEIIEQQAITRIDGGVSQDRKSYREHGHHGRQYIAAKSVEHVMKDVFPLPLLKRLFG